MNRQELETENINQNKLWIRNFSLSIFLHLLLVVAFMYFYGLQSERDKINAGFFTLDTKEFVQINLFLQKLIMKIILIMKRNYRKSKRLKRLRNQKQLAFQILLPTQQI